MTVQHTAASGDLVSGGGISTVPRGTPEVSLRDVSHSFEGDGTEPVPAVVSASFDVYPGEFLAIVGPSGCGKSTLLNIISGLLQPTEGVVTVRGEPVTGIRTDIGYMPAQDSLLPWRTVRRNVELALELRGGINSRERRDRANEMLEAVGLGKFGSYHPHALSHGMRQRVAIARTFVRGDRILLLDEPFAALDAQTRIVIQDLFLEMWGREQQTVLLITHDVVEAVALSDKVVSMSRAPGRIRGILEVELPRPRLVDELLFGSEEFQRYMRLVWDSLKDELPGSEEEEPQLPDSKDAA